MFPGEREQRSRGVEGQRCRGALVNLLICHSPFSICHFRFAIFHLSLSICHLSLSILYFFNPMDSGNGE